MADYALIQAIGTVVTALASIGIFGLAIQLYRYVKEHNRILFGEDRVEGWDGIVPMVQEHREVLEECEKLR